MKESTDIKEKDIPGDAIEIRVPERSPKEMVIDQSKDKLIFGGGFYELTDTNEIKFQPKRKICR